MSKPQESLAYYVTGILGAGSIGFALLQGLGFILAGILGAIGAWVAKEFIIPQFNKWLKRNNR